MEDRKISHYFFDESSAGSSSSKNSNQVKQSCSKAETVLAEEPIDVLLSTEYRSALSSQQSIPAQEGSDSEDEEWEDLKVETGASHPAGSQITVSFNPKKLPAEQEAEEKIRREINLMWKRLQKVQASQMLKTYSLCFLAHGIQLSNACDDPLSRSFALSVLPVKIAMTSDAKEPAKKRRKLSQSLILVNNVLDWYRENIAVGGSDLKNKDTSCPIDFSNKTAYSRVAYIQGLVLIFRSLAIRSRLLIHLWPKVLKSRKPDEIEKQSQEQSASSSTKVVKRQKSTTSEKPTKQSSYFEDQPDTNAQSNIFAFGVSREGAHHAWIEVFDSDTQKWLVIDPLSVSISTAEELEAKLTFSMSLPNFSSKIAVVVAYVVAFDENGRASDVTARYASTTLHTSTRKERGGAEQEDWWKETISLLKPSGKLMEIEETELKNNASAEKHPVPSTIAALTSHPLYVLGRHIHKYEAIYPPETQPIAHVRGEPVFDRSCVHGLHTREKWLLEGRQVRPNEEPYKTVSGHRKPLKKDELERKEPKQVGLFGHWQTSDYVPPPIVDGKLPRNVYGNIEVFKPWMLPQGCSHMTQQGIQATAKRLGIDFVPAMAGWDFHAGVNHPVIDGIVVFEDVRDVLECAWRQEKHIEIEENLMIKSERAVSNWKRLVKGILLKERLKDRYLS